MNKTIGLLLAGGVAVTALTACVDETYDLSNIDKTVQVKVDNLTVPVQFSEIYLKNILKPDAGSSLKELNGEYAVLQDGTFGSADISVDRQVITGVPIEPIVTTVAEMPALPPGVTVPESREVVSYSIKDITASFEYAHPTMPAQIQGMTGVGVNWTLNIGVEVRDGSGAFEQMTFKDVVLSLPKGLTTAKSGYNATTGLLSVGDIVLAPGVKKYMLSIPVTAVDLTKWGADFSFMPAASGNNGSMHMRGKLGIQSGSAVITLKLGSHKPSTIDFVMSPVLGSIEVNTFSGRIDYTLDSFNVPSVNISDLPDLLTDRETSLVLGNPQLYLSVNNPVANYGLTATTGLVLTPMANGVARAECGLNSGQTIAIGTDKGAAGRYSFCISPEQPKQFYTGYEGSTQVLAAAFRNLIAGEGIPNAINVTLPGAKVSGNVTNFKLGQSLGKFEGKYQLYCPLSFGDGSRLVYNTTETGWWSEDLAKVTVSSLQVKATVKNTLPFTVTLSGYPMSLVGGQDVQAVDAVTGKGVVIKEVTIPGNSETPVVIETVGAFNNLDGIHIVARAKVEQGGQVLSPDNTIKLSNVRATVTGSFTKTL